MSYIIWYMNSTQMTYLKKLKSIHNNKKNIYTKLKTDKLHKGLNIHTIYKLHKKRKEPQWMLKLRLKAFKKWNHMKEPHWINGHYNNLNYQQYNYYSAPIFIKKKKNSHKESIYNTIKNLNILTNKKKNATDIIFDSVSITNTYINKLHKLGIIFCSFQEALLKYPNIVKKYLCTVVPYTDNFYATLNTAVSSDGTFIYIPKNIICPITLNTYFRINSKNTGQFERTLIILKKNSYLNYSEGCSAPIRTKYQLHAAVVEIILYEKAEIQYTTLQNWYAGNKKNKKGILNFVTKRALCKGKNSKISWLQIETGSAITWKYPSSILLGDYSQSNFYSISLTKFNQISDTGTKVIHIGKHSKSMILSKSIALDNSNNTYRSLIKIHKKAHFTKNYTQCDSLILSKDANTYSLPTISNNNKCASIEHEASTNFFKKKQIFYLQSRGINKSIALNMIINGYCQNIINILPIDLIWEAKQILLLDTNQ